MMSSSWDKSWWHPVGWMQTAHDHAGDSYASDAAGAILRGGHGAYSEPNQKSTGTVQDFGVQHGSRRTLLIMARRRRGVRIAMECNPAVGKRLVTRNWHSDIIGRCEVNFHDRLIRSIAKWGAGVWHLWSLAKCATATCNLTRCMPP